MRGAIPTNRVSDYNMLMGMGFGRDVCINTINKSKNLNGAVDGILSSEIRGMKEATMRTMKTVGDTTVRSGEIGKQMGDGPIKAGGRIVETHVVNV